MVPVIPSTKTFTNVFQLIDAFDALPAAFHRIFRVTQGHSVALASQQLVSKYGVEAHSNQRVACITNRVTCDAAWYNAQRGRKPQTFQGPTRGPSQGPQKGPLTARDFDPTSDAKPCDFCNWQTLTAENTFGRVQGVHSVSAANLFSYCEPAHGLILFRHHQPLEFTEEQLGDLINTADDWFQAAAAQHPDAQHPLLIWNVLPRAGASQYHGHAQVLLSRAPFPMVEQHALAAEAYSARQAQNGANGSQQNGLQAGLLYYNDLLEACNAAGLVRAICTGNDSADSTGPLQGPSWAWAYPHIAPVKDMEVQVQAGVGGTLRSTAFQKLLYCVLRALIDELGVGTYNLALYNIPLRNDVTGPKQPLLARVVSRGKLDVTASDFGGLEVFGGASIANTDPFAVVDAMDRVLAQQPVP